MKICLFSRSKLLPFASCALLLATSLPAVAGNYFLQFDGVKGGSTNIDHKDWIDMQSFSWGVSVANSGGIGGGGGAGKASFSDFSWTQNLDTSITSLFSLASTGKHIKTAVVDFTTNSGGGHPFTYFKMSFKDVLLTEVNLAGGGDVPDLAGSFAYGKITLDYWTQNLDGSAGDHTSSSYDLKAGKGSAAALSALFAEGLLGPQVTAVPEPESYAMMLAGLGLLGFVARRRKQQAA